MNARSRALAALACAIALSGCSGGGATAPASRATGTTAPQHELRTSVEISFSTGAGASDSSRRTHAAKRQYVSPATLGAIVVATSTTPANRAANDLTAGFDLTAANSNCAFDAATSSFDCTFEFALVPDTYSFQLTTYDTTEAALPANPGTALSIDTETETVGSANNTFVLNPKAYVAGFSYNSFTSPAPHEGASGGSNGFFSLTVHALDRHFYLIDQYPAGVANFVNGVFEPVVTESGDPAKCTASNPCSSLENDNGTTYPAYATTSTPATIALPVNGDESLEFSYLAGGGPGSGVEHWTVGNTPTGQPPYSAAFSIPDPSNGSVKPYTVPFGYIDPLFGYATDGKGNPATTAGPAPSTVYVWAAQAHVPDGPAASGSGYAAVFASTKTTTCYDSNGTTVATIGAATYYAGFGSVFGVATTPTSLQTACSIDVLDGANDSVTIALTVDAAATETR